MARPVKVTTLPIRGCLALLRAPAWGAQAAESALHEPLRGAQMPPASAQSEGLAPRPGNHSSGFRAPWGPAAAKSSGLRAGPQRGQLTEGGALGEAGPPKRLGLLRGQRQIQVQPFSHFWKKSLPRSSKGVSGT